MAKELVCAVDQMDFQGAPPAQPYRMGGMASKPGGRSWYIQE
jgi:hypothetical protein